MCAHETYWIHVDLVGTYINQVNFVKMEINLKGNLVYLWCHHKGSLHILLHIENIQDFILQYDA